MMISKDTPSYLSLDNGKKLAYRFRKGSNESPQKPPTLVFLGGYRSDMTGTKAVFLDELSSQKGYNLLRFDYSGHGESTGDFQDGCITEWANDALTIIKTLVDGDMILIGSSMGGWISLIISRMLSDRVKGFIGVAAAPDFTDWVWNTEMTAAQQNLCKEQGYIETPDGDILTLRLFEDGEQNFIFKTPLYLGFPTILLHGKKDSVVPYQIAQKLAAHIAPEPPELILIEDGDHRLSRDEDLAQLAVSTCSLYSRLQI